MTTTRARKDRGMRTQKNVAEFLRSWFPFAESTGAGRQGADILGTPGLAIEVKARTNFDPVGWLKQAKKNAGKALAMVVLRPNGVGENAQDYLVILRFGDLMEVIGPDFGVSPEKHRTPVQILGDPAFLRAIDTSRLLNKGAIQ